MNIQQVKCFLAVADAGSFSIAAERLFLAQPTVSYQIRTLEKELGCQLFVRSTAVTRLTTAGQQLLKPTRKILEGFEEAERAVAALRTREALRLMVPPTMILMEEERVFEPLLKALSDACGLPVNAQPIEVSPESAARILCKGEAELLIAERAAAADLGDRLRVAPLFIANQYVLLPGDHPLAKRDSIPLSALEGQTVLLSNEDNCFSPAAERQDRGRRITWKRMPSYRMVISFVLRGEGVGLTSLRFPIPSQIVLKPLVTDAPQTICLMGARSLPEALWQDALKAVRGIFSTYEDGQFLI